MASEVPRKPGLDAHAEMKLVDPEQKMAARHQDAVDRRDEGEDLGFRHLRKRRALLLSGPLVAVALPVEHAAILRIEDREGEARRR